LVASQPAAQNRRTFRIDAVNLKNMQAALRPC
jgi:hypothetical protein